MQKARIKGYKFCVEGSPCDFDIEADSIELITDEPVKREAKDGDKKPSEKDAAKNARQIVALCSEGRGIRLAKRIVNEPLQRWNAQDLSVFINEIRELAREILEANKGGSK